MSREMLHGLIDMIPEDETEIIYKILIKFVPEVPPEQDEIEAITEGRRDREENGTIPHDAINWD